MHTMGIILYYLAVLFSLLIILFLSVVISREDYFIARFICIEDIGYIGGYWKWVGVYYLVVRDMLCFCYIYYYGYYDGYYYEYY